MSSDLTQWSEADQVQLFSGEGILELISTMYTQPDHAKRAALIELHHRPGAGVSGLFEVSEAHNTSAQTDAAPTDVAQTDAAQAQAAQAQTAQETQAHQTHHAVPSIFVVATTERIAADVPDVARIHAAPEEIVLWEHPNDPGLPGLATASIPERVQAHWGSGGDLLDLQTVSYRPLRRAVLKAKFSHEPDWYFLKVLRKDAQLLWHKHVLLAQAGVPVPQVVGSPVDEVVAFRTVAGTPMARSIMDSVTPPIAADQIVSLLTRFPATLQDVPARPAWTDRLHWYAHAARTAVPQYSQRIDALKASIDTVLEHAERGPLVTNHGDFYEANVFVSGGDISGLIDIDSAGPGYLIDDLACFIGHLAVLPTLDRRYAHVPSFVDYYLAEFSKYLSQQGITVAGLYARSASVVLTLIAGARDEEDPNWESSALARLEVAESLFARLGQGSAVS